jgi:tRNA-splicing ligase RtcB
METKKIDEYRWEVPKTGAMRVPGIVYASESMLKDSDQKEPLKQVANVATLPGILKASLAMPDMHWGYGFPIGGVAAFDWESGIISPGGVSLKIWFMNFSVTSLPASVPKAPSSSL